MSVSVHCGDRAAASSSTTSVQPVTTTGDRVSVSVTTTTNSTPSRVRTNRQPSEEFQRSCPVSIAREMIGSEIYRPGWVRRSRRWSVCAYRDGSLIGGSSGVRFFAGDCGCGSTADRCTVAAYASGSGSEPIPSISSTLGPPCRDATTWIYSRTNINVECNMTNIHIQTVFRSPLQHAIVSESVKPNRCEFYWQIKSGVVSSGLP